MKEQELFFSVAVWRKQDACLKPCFPHTTFPMTDDDPDQEEIEEVLELWDEFKEKGGDTDELFEKFGADHPDFADKTIPTESTQELKEELEERLEKLQD